MRKIRDLEFSCVSFAQKLYGDFFDKVAFYQIVCFKNMKKIQIGKHTSSPQQVFYVRNKLSTPFAYQLSYGK